ncbi:MAG: SpoIIE family protein phosphatase [Myxococcales bacterium]|nr:SpoIIE family protein phosphatase [Myxococcales bacterium]
MRRHLLIALITLIASGVGRLASAQALKTVEHLAPPLSFDRLGNADGLPNSDIRAIVQDRRGFLWFGTQDGLARYDGTTVRVFRPNETDPASISGAYITALTVDSTGKLWVGTAENGVNLYDPETDRFTRFVTGAKGSLSGDGVTAIARDAKDRMWFALSSGGLNRFDPATKTFVEYLTGALETTVTAMAVDKAGSLWLGTVSDGALRWNPDDGTTTSYRPTPGDDSGLGASPITSVLVASTGQIWFGSDGDGLTAFDPASKKLTHYRHAANNPATISDDHVSALLEDRQHNLWIGTTNGLNRMAATGGLVQFHHDPNDATSLAFPGVESLYQDAGGVVWVGGFTVGVCKFDELRVKFGHYRTRTHSANSYFEDPDALWVGTYNGGLYKYDWAAQRVTHYQSLGTPGAPGAVSLESTWIAALHRDRRGTLWMALKGQGLIAFDSNTEGYQQYLPDPKNANSLPVDTIWDIWEDERGALWLATWGGGLVRFDPKLDTFTAITADESGGISSNHLYALYPDPIDAKQLWIGTAKGGLVRYDTAAGTGTSFRHKDDDPTSLSNDDVLTVYRDKTSVWVGTYGGGLNRLDPATGKAQRMTVSNSQLPNDVIFGVLPDDDGKLWLSTNGGGLVQLDPKTGKALVYHVSDGVQDNEFGQGSFKRSKSGKLYFGGVGGFNAFLPRDITRDPYVPPVVMTGFKVFNQEVKLDRPVWTLPPVGVSYSDSFELQFAALSFAAPGKNRYAYKLEGFDDKFIETDRPFATYTKLDGGNYTLRIRAANRHGAWNETGLALAVSVSPPIWRTWPAFALYLVVLAVVVYLLFRMQQQKVRRIERDSRLAVVERDLALSGAVQSGFLPEYNEINSAGLQLFGFYRAADACSGDWWWHEASGGRHVVLVGDVTGHGPGPAMVTAAVATAFRVITGNGLPDVQRALELLNQVVLQVAKGNYHMTMAAVELDESTGRWVFYNAGAPPMLSLDHTGKHTVHFCAGSPLGTETEFEIGRVEGQLAPSGRILLYTDGIPEITLPNGNVLGMRKFAQMYEGTRATDLRGAAAGLVQLADQTQAGQPQADDWTFTLLEWRGNRTGSVPFQRQPPELG